LRLSGLNFPVHEDFMVFAVSDVGTSSFFAVECDSRM
jgi:hypothetical protein